MEEEVVEHEFVEEPGNSNGADEAQRKERLDLVKTIRKRIEDDKRWHRPAFNRMREDMHMALWGATKQWREDGNYIANIAGRHVKQKTAALYAKNPRVIARRRQTLDFEIWEEDQQSLVMAMQMVGQMAPGMPGAAEVQDLLEDIKQGLERKKLAKRIGRTLEILFGYFMEEQQPLDFKSAMKALVRRACTTCVGYVEIGFQRELGPRPTLENELLDVRRRLDTLNKLLQDENSQNDSVDLESQRAELDAAIMALQNEPEVILREGLVFDFPRSTAVIPDKNCTSLTGFVGANHLTVELMYTQSQVESRFGVDLSNEKLKRYSALKRDEDTSADDMPELPFDETFKPNGDGDLVLVQKHYDKNTGLMYVMCEGYDDFLQDPAAPDVTVEGFFPVLALTFNACESDTELFPPSDVRLLYGPQMEHNRSRNGMREHRYARLPRWATGTGALSDEEKKSFGAAKPYSVVEVQMAPGEKLQDKLQPLPVPGVDPNLYETGQYFSDSQIIVGAQQAQLGGVSKSTATESAIAAESSNTADGASIDELDSFLTRIARLSGQVLMLEMSEEKVREICGPGAVWPEASLRQVQAEIALEIEAGSTGKPHQAIEVKNMQMMMPFLMQLPGLNPEWLAKEAVRRLDDRIDLAEALAAGMPSIMMMNQQKQLAQGEPGSDPNAQGQEGGNNAAKPGPDRPAGSTAPMGDNHGGPMGPGDTGAV